MRREEKPARCHWMVYCTYYMLNTFRTLSCPSSGARDYMCIIIDYGVRCLGCWLLEVRCWAAGYASGMRNVARLAVEQHPSFRTHSLLATKTLHTIVGNNTHIVSSSWWWEWKCPKRVEHIIRAINHSVASSWFFFCTWCSQYVSGLNISRSYGL